MKLEHGRYVSIPGYPRYEINHQGDIRRLWNNAKPTVLSPSVKKGQYVIRLMRPDGSRKEERVHKLMQTTFFSPKPGHVFYHKNGNRLDNWINNLGYIESATLGKKTGGSSRRRSVMKIDLAGEIVEIYRSARYAASENFMSYQTIMDRCNGKVKNPIAPDGFIYRWEESENGRSKKVM